MPVYASGAVDYGAADPQAVNKGFANANSLMQGFAQRQAGQDMAAGDPTGAQNTLYRAGDLAGGASIQDRQQSMLNAKHAQELKFVSDTADALQAVKQNGGDPLEAFDKLMPIFKQREGADDETMANLRNALASDPDAFLQTMSVHAKDQLQKLAQGEILVGPDGKVIARNAAAPKQYVLPPGGALVQGPEDPSFAQQPLGSAQPPTQAAPTGAVPASGPPPSPPVQQVLAQIRQNPAAAFGSVLGGPVQITSGYRDPAQNAAIPGASSTSEHMTNSAWDFLPPPGMSHQQAIAKLVATGMPYDQIIDEGDHIHVGFGPKMRREVLQQTATGYTRIGGSPPPVAPSVTTSPGSRVLATNPAKPEPDFSLAPGATRYDAHGNVIVKSPAIGGPGGKLPTQDAARLKAMDTMLDNAENLADMSQQFMQRAHGVNTGPQWNQFGGHSSGSGGANVGGVRPGAVYDYLFNPDEYSKIQELDALTNRATPMLRPVGSGRILGPEYTNFGRAFPSTKNTSAANGVIDGEYHQQLGTIRPKVLFFHKYADEHGNLNGADAAWVQNRHEAIGASAPRRRVWTPQGGLQ